MLLQRNFAVTHVRMIKVRADKNEQNLQYVMYKSRLRKLSRISLQICYISFTFQAKGPSKCHLRKGRSYEKGWCSCCANQAIKANCDRENFEKILESQLDLKLNL